MTIASPLASVVAPPGLKPKVALTAGFPPTAARSSVLVEVSDVLDPTLMPATA